MVAPQKHLGVSVRRNVPERRKLAALITSILLLLVFGYLSWRQPSPGQLDPSPVFPSLKWFRYPSEVNPQNRPPTYPRAWFWYPFAVKPEQRPPQTRPSLTRIALVPGTNGNTLVIPGENGRILRTDDGGYTWTSLGTPTTEDLLAVTFTNPLIGWAVGGDGTVLLTSDGGFTWARVKTPSKDVLTGVAFWDPRNGLAVGLHGTLLRTFDGGSEWFSEGGLPPNRDLWALTALRDGIAWVVGEDGTIVRLSVLSPGIGSPSPLGRQEVKSGVTTDLTDIAFTGSSLQTGWVVGQDGVILHTVDGGQTWTKVRSPTAKTLVGVTFADTQTGWVVGNGGTILRTVDGGSNWDAQGSGTAEDLNGVAPASPRVAWVAGDHGTVLHTTDGGSTWSTQDAFMYRRYPAPWFYLAVACLLPVFVWSLIPIEVPSATIQDSVTSDSPVETLDGDRLGQRPLVERLSGFLQNPNTLPPLVISLQAPWGMGKSTVMRMLQSNLERNRAAVTVWFNAWHHQTEDQLLAYLLETIQREVVPQWLSRNGVPFRLNLIRVRLFSWGRVDRLALVLTGIFFIVATRLNPDWLSGVPYHQYLPHWVSHAAPFVGALPILDALIAFKSNPDKLTSKTGGFLVDTFKELISLSSLVGKSDVRQEFASNLRDVVAALRPQRLVIFLDDLDRCKPEQVVQILESINFLSSVAQCFLIVGADYGKVETLVANQFETIALREAENRGNNIAEIDAIRLRVEFARNYLKKIVNLRLNLHPPAGFVGLLTDRTNSRAQRSKLQPIATACATVALLTIFVWGLAPRQQSPTAQVISPVVAAVAPTPPAAVAAPAAPAQPPSGVVVPGPPVMPRLEFIRVEEDGATVRNLLSLGLPLLLVTGALYYWFNLPRKVEEAQDVDSFTKALRIYSKEIFEKCGSPREARRFLNYLRLVATGSGQKEGDDLRNLRMKYHDQFDLGLVALAVTGDTDGIGEISEVRQYYKAQCDLFGLDERTFQPRESGVSTI